MDHVTSSVGSLAALECNSKLLGAPTQLADVRPKSTKEANNSKIFVVILSLAESVR